MSIPRYIINLGHAGIVAPFIGYLGWLSYNEEEIKIPKNMGIILLIISIIVVIYHLYIFTNVSYPMYKKNLITE